MNIVSPYGLPDVLPSFLPSVLSYWSGLRRGQAEIPFADDINRTALSEYESDLVLIDVFSKPSRHRFAIVGKRIAEAYGGDLEGIFLDEFDPRPPLDLLHSQASAAVETCKPNFYRTGGYARLMLPAWADGRVSALLSAIASAS